MKPIIWSYGMQSRGGSRIGERPDIEGSVKALRDIGGTEAIIFAKDHTGFCFYPTEIGVIHPKLKINLTKLMTDELHKYNMKAIAYYNIGMDGEAARKHPEYLKYSAPGVTLNTADHYAEICIFGPCYEELIRPLVKEIFVKNNVDGIFFDPTGCFNYCCCETCKADFKKQFGEELRSPEATPDDVAYWSKYSIFLSTRIKKFISNIREEIHSYAPEARVIFNHTGGPFGQTVDYPGVNEDGGISCDPPAAYPLVSMFANYTGALPYKGDVFIERFARCWGDRSNLDDFSLQHKFASIFMYGARACVGDRMHPDCSMAPGSIHAMKTIGRLHSEMDALIPESAGIDSDIICMISKTYMGGRFGENAGYRYGDAELLRRDTIGYLGFYRMMVDCGRSFTISPELLLKHNLRKGKLLIVPTLHWMKPHVEEAIREFVADGGKVLFTEHVPFLDDDSIPDFMGIESVEKTPYQPCVYLPDWGDERPADMEKTLVEGNIFRIKLSTAKAELFGYPQYDLYRMGAGYNSSADEQWDIPLLTHNKYGKGDVYFLNAPLFTDYVAGHPDQLRWTKLFFKYIFPESKVVLDSESGNVEMSAYTCSPEKSLYILLNHGGRQTDLVRFIYSEKIVQPQPVYPVVLKRKVNSEKVSVKINGVESIYDVKNGVLEVPIAMDSLWKIVEVTEI